ncbi:hypothetical protein Ae168Ps1_3753c [Pseudonocardia sp. Ae168_Ps1]|nr:hypothetical protein Ae150APs1_3730c [Pseudonocardia sp. Ae150A_Ps1]OLL81347.1 hypothetical protein Ae168Ps1_3753c [Pseudonocardia sp. Ae168_Ps1]OLL84539.1 hypothetical protein Ae263Ps1_1594 [Pseudonocardia sp. Ae263_Ps1]OLL95442.1 hypothetical protein Ae356Ps1_5339c [Pseudonocardia sp. Ae356_Ps1]
MTVVEQRYRAVPAVEQGEPHYQVAAQFGVSRQTTTPGSPAAAWTSWPRAHTANARSESRSAQPFVLRHQVPVDSRSGDTTSAVACTAV